MLTKRFNHQGHKGRYEKSEQTSSSSEWSDAISHPPSARPYSSVTNLLPAAPIVPGLGLTIVGLGQTSMAVYAPNAIVTFTGLNDFYGAVGGMIPNVGITRCTTIAPC